MFSKAQAAGIVLALLTLCPNVAAAERRAAYTEPDHRSADLSELTETLEIWLDTHGKYHRRDTPVSIELIDDRYAGFLNGNSGLGHGRTRGLYDADTSTIYLVEPWSAEDPQDVSVLLHELVHHRQAPHHFFCPAAQEEAAYKLQDQWLGERGMQADVNWIAVILDAGCRRRDVHPD